MMMPAFSRALRARWILLLMAILFTVSACSGSQEAASPAPSAAADETQASPLSKRAEAANGMVAAAHPLAAQAGVDMLQQGGNAIDAAVATAFVLNVVEPMMAGIGGGGSMTIWRDDAAAADFVEFYASAGADPDYELEQIPDSTRSRERMVAVPGAVDGLLSAHERYGTLAWADLLQPVAANYASLIEIPEGEIDRAEYEDRLTYDPDAAAVFYPGGEPLQAGDLLVQSELANTLQRIAEQGRGGFYLGPTARNLVEKLQAGGSPLTLDDFRNYESRWRKPLCGQYKGYTVLAATPPLDGVEVLETLELLEPYDLTAMGIPAEDPDALSHVVDAIRIARTDRALWVGDPDDTGVPAVGLSSPEFADARRSLMERETVPDSMVAGDPWDAERQVQPTATCRRLGAYPPTTLPKPDTSAVVDDEDPEESETTHLSVVDAEGNAVSLTYTMGLYFGSAVYSDGAFYNSAALNFDDDVVANQRAPHAAFDDDAHHSARRRRRAPRRGLARVGPHSTGHRAHGALHAGLRVRPGHGHPHAARLPVHHRADSARGGRARRQRAGPAPRAGLPAGGVPAVRSLLRRRTHDLGGRERPEDRCGRSAAQRRRHRVLSRVLRVGLSVLNDVKPHNPNRPAHNA